MTKGQFSLKSHIAPDSVRSVGNLPYLEDIDGKDVDVPGDVKGFSCIPAKGVEFNGNEKVAPQCYIVSQ
jgi:hypothetical protein